ncbi:M81 family metallopeptidase [Natrialba sp. SSL1]|uniref:M81 family metallopeptidase n=1 Tax=Natrialba sp. SSL1 TaxID=1869245 RepID=UPI0008F93B80|nr:M81 family metallopeptidase [Natrialba sp. SSL1]OIB55279.1 microcystin degradation protein MlrC [Natrialba sp. SSL1]
MATETVLVGSISHETNTFADGQTTRENFQNRREYFGEDVYKELRDTNTGVGGVIEITEEEEISLITSLAVSATPGATVAREAFEFYRDRLLSDIREYQDEIDGIILPLHGAMVVEGRDDGEGPLVSSIREIVGDDLPIVVTLDLHGNVTDELVDETDAIVAYETYPHVDMAATGRRGFEILIETIRGDCSPVMHIERPPLSPVTPTQNTQEGPMAELMEYARSIEERDKIVKVNVFPGFSRSDVPSMGFSVPVIADGDPAAAKAASRDLSEKVWEVREEFVGDFLKPPKAVTEAKEKAADISDDDGPVVLADVGDNPGGGGAANGTTILRELIKQEVTNAGMAIIRDPEVVEECIQTGVGNRVTVTLGGKTDDRHGEPIKDLDSYVKAITDGEFLNYGPKGTGTKNYLGRTVRLQCGTNDEIDVIVTENRHQPADTEIWRHVGVQPERFDILVVKSTNHYRADYEPRASHVIPVDSPGLAAMNPRQFDHQNVHHPIYPIDNLSAEDYPDW